MLIRNCVTSLLKENDDKVRVTVFKRNPRFYIQGGYKHSWLESVRDTLGPGIIWNSTDDFVFSLIYEEDNRYGYKKVHCRGNQILDEISNLFDWPKSLRIECLPENPSKSTRTWIVLVL